MVNHGTQKLTRKLAKTIKEAIEEYTEYFSPYTFDSVEIVGGIQKRGYSYHDIDIKIDWLFDVNSPKEGLEQIKRTLEHIVHFWLKRQGFPIEKLDIHSYIYFGSYNLGYGGWTMEKFEKKQQKA